MSEENKEMVRRHLEQVWNQKNMAAIDELFAPDFRNYDPIWPQVKSLQEYKQWVMYLTTMFPDWTSVEEDMLAEGDKVVTRWTITGTVSDQYQEEAARGRKVVNTGINIHRLVDGKIQELWWGYDQLGINQQLGVT